MKTCCSRCTNHLINRKIVYTIYYTHLIRLSMQYHFVACRQKVGRSKCIWQGFGCPPPPPFFLFPCRVVSSCAISKLPRLECPLSLLIWHKTQRPGVKSTLKSCKLVLALLLSTVLHWLKSISLTNVYGV